MVRVHVPVVTLLTVLTLATPVAAGEPAPLLGPEGAAAATPRAVGRTAPGDTVRVVRFTVKPDDRDEFERFFRESLLPAAAKRQGVEPEDASLGAFRLLVPTEANPQGAYTYYVLVDPITYELGSEQTMRDRVREAFPGEEGESRVARWMQTIILEPPFAPQAGNFLEADLKAPSDDDGDARPPDPGSLSTMKADVSSPDGVRISYEARGEGAPALVFVHGWSCDRTYWQAQLDRFSREHRVVAVDLAGHGESGLGREAWTMRAFGGDVAAVVDALGLQRTVLIGHSMGGDVIVEAARRLPGRVDGLVWVDVYRQLGSGRTPEAVQARLAPFRDDFEATTVEFVRGMFPPGTDASLVDSVAADMSAAPPAVALEALESAWNYSREVTVALEELKLPVVAINPDDGSTDLESLTRHGVRPVLMEGVGHFLMMEKPEAFNELLAEVIDDLGG